MDNTVKIERFLNEGIFIDVRSPSEYESGTIDGAINIPILDDKEREEVGTLYVRVDKVLAKRKGVELVAKKLPDLFDQVMSIRRDGRPLICFCARGGYRSKSFASFFSSIGINIFRVDGGYKAYRKHLQETMPKLCEEFKFVTIHGNTGVGKTDILHELEKRGEAILDIEGCANHRGSLLGSIGIGACNTQKTFEDKLFFSFLDAVKKNKKIIYTEAESKTIGRCKLPSYVHEKMQVEDHIFVDADYEYRARSLEKDYVLNENWIDESVKALDKIRRYMSNAKIDELQEMTRQGNFKDVAIILMRDYYDPMYEHKSDTFNYTATYKAKIDAADVAEQIIKK